MLTLGLVGGTIHLGLVGGTIHLLLVGRQTVWKAGSWALWRREGHYRKCLEERLYNGEGFLQMSKLLCTANSVFKVCKFKFYVFYLTEKCVWELKVMY